MGAVMKTITVVKDSGFFRFSEDALQFCITQIDGTLSCWIIPNEAVYRALLNAGFGA